jgi:hypothetical protein
MSGLRAYLRQRVLGAVRATIRGLAPVVVGGVLLAALTGAVPARAGLEPYAESNDPMTATPSTDDGAFAAWHNPAAWAVPERPLFDLGLFGRDLSDQADQLRVDGWQAGIGRGLGFAVRHRDGVPSEPVDPRIGSSNAGGYFNPYGNYNPALPSLTEYQFAMAAGNERERTGFAWHVNDGGGHAWHKSNFLSLGQIARPNRFLSIGWSNEWAPATGDGLQIYDVGFRPDGTSRLTLFGDYSSRDFFRFEDGEFGVGAAIRPFDGVEISGRWRTNDRFQFTAGLTLARFGLRATPVFEHLKGNGLPYGTTTRDDYIGSWLTFRASPPVRGIDVERVAARKSRFLAMDLHGRAVYQSYRWFDRDSKPLRDLTEQIRFAKDDPTVGGVAIRLSGFEANSAMMWELRESLLELKRAGKKVLIAADNLDERSYYFACVADRLVLDPLG